MVDSELPDLPPHLKWHRPREDVLYILLVGSNEGVAGADRASNGYRCISAPHGVTSDKWIEQIVETEKEVAPLLAAWAMLEICDG